MIRLLLGLALAASPGEDAVRLYAEGDFAGAERAFLAAADDPAVSRGALEYDLGNCAFRQGRLAEAVWRYRRAARWLPEERWIVENRERAEAELGLGPALPRRGPFDAWLAPLIFLDVPVLEIGLAGIVLLQTVGLLGLLFGARGWRWRLACLLLVLVGLGAGVAWLREEIRTDHPSAVVLADTAPLHREPHADQPVVGQLTAGRTVEVLARSEHWLEVRADDRTGWCPAEALGRVE